jgi:hypothetical protein
MQIEISKDHMTAGRGLAAKALVDVRITKTQIIVLNGDIIFRSRPGTFPAFYNRTSTGAGSGPIRFWRKNGKQLGASWHVPSWYVAPEQLEKINQEVI